MQCDRCKTREATVHIRRETPTGFAAERHFCETCSEELELFSPSGESQFLFPWEEHGAGSFSFSGIVSKITPEAVVLRAVRCSHYPPGAEISLPPPLLPKAMRVLGHEFNFNFAAEKLAAILVQMPSSG
jgi:hypothetical protein